MYTTQRSSDCGEAGEVCTSVCCGKMEMVMELGRKRG